MYTPVILEFAAKERSQRLRRTAATHRLLRGNTRRKRGRHQEESGAGIT